MSKGPTGICQRKKEKDNQGKETWRTKYVITRSTQEITCSSVLFQRYAGRGEEERS